MKFILFLPAFLSLLPACAHSDTLDYKFSGVEEELCGVYGGDACVPSILEFTVSSNPIISENPNAGNPQQSGVFVAGSQLTVLQNSTPAEPSYGITFSKNSFLIDSSNFYGFSFDTFSGSTSAPTLLTGMTSAEDYLYFTSYELSGNLIVTDLDATPTPEPSTIALFGTGLLGALGVVRRRLAS